MTEDDIEYELEIMEIIDAFEIVIQIYEEMLTQSLGICPCCQGNNHIQSVLEDLKMRLLRINNEHN
jgi:hypothetical protein